MNKYPRALRGEQLDKKTLRLIDEWPSERKLSWAALAERVGVTRQSLERKPILAEAFWARKERLKSGNKARKDSVEESFERQIRALQEKNAILEKNLDMHIEKFARAERNCLVHGWDADKLWAPFKARKEN
jgi:hypothetical protein